MPDIQGYRIASLCPVDERSIFSQYSRIRQSPWILAVMGQCNGVPMWQACLSDFVIQVNGALPPEERQTLVDKMIQDSGAYPLAQEFYIQDIIDPRVSHEP